MKKWENISDYLFFQEGPGVRNHQYTTDGVKLLNVANLVNGRVDLSTSERYISSDEAYGKYKHFLADEGDLIIASSGIKVDYFDKKMGFIRKEHLPICMNTSTIRFKSIDKSKLDINYFMYYLKSQSFKDQLSKQITGSAQLNFGPSHLKKMEFPIVDIEEQSSINSVLGNIQSQIRLKEEQLTEYDQLIKSRFVEMFGDPTSNPNGHDIKSIYELFDVGSSKRVFESEWTDKGVPFYRAREIVKLAKDGFVENDLFITEEMYEDYKSKFGVPKANDMMVTGVGTLGVCYIVKDTDRFYFKDGNTLWFKNKGLCDINFIKNQFDTDFVKDQIIKNANVSTVGTYTITNAKNTQVIVPPLSMQKEFAAFVNQVDKLKFEVQKSLNETQMLFDSLMQEYFG